MNTINLTGYPIFTPNQVLTKDDLNGSVSYLDGLNRLTRTHLIGMGIVCGLEVQTLDNRAEIWITPGCGITSEGFCIQYAPIADEEDKEEAKQKNTFTHYRDNVPLAKNLFIKSESSQENYLVRELITAEQAQTNPQGIQPLTALSQKELESQVLVILYDWEDLTRQDYCQFSYDDRGQERSFRLRFLLLPSQNTKEENLSAERLLRQGYQMNKLPERWEDFATQEIFELRKHFLQEFDRETNKFQDFAPQVQRFGYMQGENTVDLTKIYDYKTFRENYDLICKNAIAAIGKAFPRLFWLFSPFFTAFQPKSGDDFSQLQDDLEYILKGIKLENILDYFKVKEINKEIETLIKSEQIQSTYNLQYFYDYLSLLVAAYYELAEAAFDLMDDCTPDTRRFPRVLMLGLVPPPSQGTEVYAAPSAYRSHFTQPPIYNANQLRVKQVRYLYQRLLKLCEKDSFYLLPFYNTPLKITPSKDQSTPLSKQAIPYYLNYPNLYQYWNYDAYRKGRSNYHPAYFYPKKNAGEKPHEFKELTYRLDGYNFYRIEGHIGKANADVVERIQEYQQRYNLAFDVIALKVGSQITIQDLKFYGQFDDLELDFGRMKEIFQELYNKYLTEPKNVLLHTLKQAFFEQPSLTAINYNQLFNPILEIAQKPENYKFLPVEEDNSENTGRFKLSLQDYSNQSIARYAIQDTDTEGNNLNHYDDLIIDFSGLANDDAIEQEKQRITKDMVDCLTRSKVTYGVVVDDSSGNSVKYYLKLSTENLVNLPPNNRQYSLVLLSLNYFTVSIDNNNDPEIKKAEFRDFQTLHGLLRDVPEKFDTTKYKIGNPEIAEELNYFVSGLIDPYQQRLEQLMKLHLFHKFAQQHPGMEHLGGVPKGGTFILVYVDGQEVDELLSADKDSDIYNLQTSRTKAIQQYADFPPAAPQELIGSREELLQELKSRKDVIVGDFCLSYRLPRTRPIIWLKKRVFCEDDSNKYQFILQPEGGVVKGEGVLFEGHKQLFQPSRIDQASKDKLKEGLEVAITFTYAVDDTYDILTVTIYPLPDASFQIGGGENKTSFCAYDDPVALTPKLTGGKFQVLDAEKNVLENIIKDNQFIPSALLGEGETQKVITIEYTITSDKGCTKSEKQQVTIFALPQADLSISDGQNFCNNADPVEITLAEGTPEQVELIQVKINDTQTNTLNPSQYATGNDAETVTITALIRDRQTQCTNTLTRSITINPLPQAELSISDGQSFCQNAEPINITLAEGTPENIELIDVTINDIQTSTLNFSEFATEGVAETITITALIRDRQTQCENNLTRTVIINPLPQADLSISDGQNFCNNADPVEITLAESTPEQVELIQVKINDTQTNTLNPSQYATGDDAETVTITALIRDRQTQCTNTLTRSITINPLPQAELSILDGQSFCQNAEPINITLAEGTPENIELINVKINDTQTNTLNPREYATEGVAEAITITVLIRNQQTQCTNTLTRNITINPLPQADFQTEITNISETGFVVRVFDIQPAEETSFTFNWEHDGIPNDSNPGNNEFIISYNYDPDTWDPEADKSITLRVQTPPDRGSCTSDPVTKTITIPLGGVQEFNLLNISNNEVFTTLTDERENTFNISEFDLNNEYAIAAITIPATVGSVVFTYTAPNAEAENLQAIASPYFMNWQPTVGIHQITAQTARGINSDRLEGISSTIVIRVNEDGNNGENGTDTPTQPRSRSFTLLNRFRVLFEPDSKNTTESKIFS